VGFDATAVPVLAGPCRPFIGKRSDPFFADADGVLHWLIDGRRKLPMDRGRHLRRANIFSIVLRCPTTCSAGRALECG
jgi:hypothetical protein